MQTKIRRHQFPVGAGRRTFPTEGPFFWLSLTSWRDLSWLSSGRPALLQTSPWQLTFSMDGPLGISYLVSAKRFQEMVLWKHIFKMKTDKAAGSGAKENSTLSEKQAVCWHWKPMCSHPPLHPLIKALAHTPRHTDTQVSAPGLQNML